MISREGSPLTTHVKAGSPDRLRAAFSRARPFVAPVRPVHDRRVPRRGGRPGGVHVGPVRPGDPLGNASPTSLCRSHSGDPPEGGSHGASDPSDGLRLQGDQPKGGRATRGSLRPGRPAVYRRRLPLVCPVGDRVNRSLFPSNATLYARATTNPTAHYYVHL